jgi:hypothetical protein
MMTDLSYEENKIVNKRLDTVLGIWDKVSRSPYFIESGDIIFHLNAKLLGEVVSHYIHDLRALKLRYKISGKVQFPKIAGLMTNAFVKYKPLVPRIGNNDLKPNSLKANEVFAVFYGLCVLFDMEILPNGELKTKTGKNVRDFMCASSGLKWRDDLIYLLNSRNYTAESLIAVFDTLCIALCPDLLKYESEG